MFQYISIFSEHISKGSLPFCCTIFCWKLWYLLIFKKGLVQRNAKQQTLANSAIFWNCWQFFLWFVPFVASNLCLGTIFWKRGIWTECDSSSFPRQRNWHLHCHESLTLKANGPFALCINNPSASTSILSEIEIAWYVLFCVVSATGGGPVEDILWATETRGGCQR